MGPDRDALAPLRWARGEVCPPYSVQFELTFRCNLRCTMCYNGSGPGRAGELSDAEWIEVVQQTIDAGIMEAIISGGEPLLRGKALVLRLLEMLSDAGVATHLITNGALVDRAFVRDLRGLNLRIVQTSIDGPTPEVHDAIRGRNFHDVTRATSLLASHGFMCRVGCTIQRLNERLLQEMVELAALLGAQEIVVDQFLPIGRALSAHEALAPSRSHEEIRQEVEALGRMYAHLITVRQGMLCHDQLRQQAAQEVNDGVIIRPDGQLRLGCMAPFTCGNVRHIGFAELWRMRGAGAWHTPLMREYVEAVQDNAGLMAAYGRLDVVHGYENVSL